MNELNVWKKARLLFILPVAWIWASQINIAPDRSWQSSLEIMKSTCTQRPEHAS